MNSLPHVSHKVSIRSKTASFKRPISCDVSENKRDGKGIFFKLKKGSSNSRLDEESQYRENSSIYNKQHATFNHKNNQENHALVTRIQGRNFDSDDDEYEIDSGDTIVTKMEKIFNNNEKVVRNPALLGLLLKYLVIQNLNYYGVLFYLITQHYKSTIQNKEFAREALRFINEIYTTFLHEKSVLKIDHVDMKPIVFEDIKTTKDVQSVFEESSNFVFIHCISKNIEKVKTSIAHGLFHVDCNIEVMNFDEKLSYFNGIIKYIIKNLDDKLVCEQNQNATKESKEQESFLQDVISGVKSALATVYLYFSKREKEENADNVSVVSSKFNSFLGKSSENLQLMTNCILEKYPTFCSKLHKKQGHSFFKKGKIIKHHNFQEKNFEYPADCILCNKVLWGIAPQGLMCSYCQAAVHRNCRDFVRISCQRDIRKYQRNSSSNTQIEDESLKNSIVEENNVKEVLKNINIDSKDNSDDNNRNKVDDKPVDTIDGDHQNSISSLGSEDNMYMSITSLTSDISQSSKVSSSATIVITCNEDQAIEKSACDTESLDSVPDIYHFDKQLDSIKYESEKSDLHMPERRFLTPSYVPAGHVRSMACKIDERSIPRSQSENNIERSTLPRATKRASESVHVQDLIQDSVLWSKDEDMMVGETFEADKELESFPDHLKKEQDKAEYTRLLVLMEFHHKTKFTVMTLKRFDYLLIKSWPSSDDLLFRTLSLDCIVPLYKLIKELVNTIESCRMKSTFTPDTATKVYQWLVGNGESNLQQWLKYSIDLCCTNSLLLVKNTWKEYRKSDPRFSQVLSRQFNKMVMVEQLSNMRPLLFNFPLIINKLVRDLSKFSQFKDEVKIWKGIYEKFKLLPTFIDEHCMPLVQLINNGTIINSLDRSGWVGKLNENDPSYNYIIDFPKTAFHYKLFDFQEIRISNFRESGNKELQIPAVFVKETCDAYAICYENILVLLQKENDKYVLKQFKGTSATKCSPILILENMHPSKGDKKGNSYELTLIFINVAVLTQVLFNKKDVMERWHDFIFKMKNIKKVLNINNNNTENSGSSQRSIAPNNNDSNDKENDNNNNTNINSISVTANKSDNDTTECYKNEFQNGDHREILNEDSPSNQNDESGLKIYDVCEGTEDMEVVIDEKHDHHDCEIILEKLENMKEPIDDYLSSVNLLKLFKDDENVLFSKPNNPFELFISTMYDAGKLLKFCNDGFNVEVLNNFSSSSLLLSSSTETSNSTLSVPVELLDKILSCLWSMQNRIIHWKTSQDRDFSSLTGTDYITSDINEPFLQSVEDTPPESVNEVSDDIPFQIMDNPLSESTDIKIEDTESTVLEESYLLPDFVTDFVDNLIADAQREIILSFESDSNSDVQLNNDNNFLPINHVPEQSSG